MRFRIKITLSFLAFIVAAGVSGQQFYNSVKPLTTASNTLNYKITGNQYYFWPKYMGTVYLNDDWSHASLKLENGDIYDDVYVRLNTLFDELLLYNERVGSVITVDKSIIDEFELKEGIESYHLFRKVYLDKYPKGYHYVNVLYDGKVKLYLWHETEIAKTTLYKNPVGGGMFDSEYKQEFNYFIVYPDGSMHKVVTKRRSFLQLFPEQKRTLKRLFRRAGVHFYTNQELIEATKIIEEEIF